MSESPAYVGDGIKDESGKAPAASELEIQQLRNCYHKSKL
jgi:hypothetical protein